MLDTQMMRTIRTQPADFVIGRFVLRGRERLLFMDGAAVALGSRAVEVLLALVEGEGALLSKHALLDRVWPDVTVEENNLQVQISALRRVLGDNRDWIVTVPGRGYRFIGPVSALPHDNAGMPTTGAESLPEPATEPPSLSILVLPFAGRGDDPARYWFADGVTDSLTTDLARALPTSGAVTAQASADLYRDHLTDVREIGRQQGVRYVLEGSVLMVEDRVRVNAQLIVAETGAHLWADRFDTAWIDVLRAQDEIVGRLARAVKLRMIDAEARRAGQAEW